MDIRANTKWDGVILMAENWQVFRARTNMRIKFPFWIRQVSKTTYRGLPLFDDKRNCFDLTIGYIDGMDIKLCISVDKEKRLDYTDMLKLLVECMVAAVNQMSNSNTNLDWIGKGVTTVGKIVFLDDIPRFGNNLMRLMKPAINEMYMTVVELKIVVMELGQSTAMANLTRFLEQFEIGYIETLVFHVAVDFACPNYLVGWSYKKTKEALGQPTSQYYAGCLKGVGNFVFMINNEDEQDFQTPCEIVKIQCYSALFKSVHRSKELIFGSINIAKDLISPAECSPHFCKKKVVNWDTYNTWIRAVHSLLENIEQNYRMGQSARSEFVVNISAPIDPDVHTEIVNELKLHRKYSPKILRRCLVKVRLDDLIQHFRVTLRPALNTLSSMINGRILALKQGTMEEFSPDDYGTAVLCEAIVGYHLYGNISFRGGKYMYPSWVVKALELRNYKYKETESSAVCREWMFPDVLRQYEVDGYDTPLLVLMRFDTKQGINLLDNVRLQDFVADGVKATVMAIHKLAENEVIARDHGQEQEMMEFELETTLCFLLKCLTDSAHEYFKIQLPGVKCKPEDLCYNQAASWGRIQLATSFEIVTYIFDNQQYTTKHCFLRWLIEFLKWAANGTNCLKTVKLKLAMKLEKSLLDKESGFVFPVSEQVQYHRVVVLPVAGIKALPPEKVDRVQHKIAWLYMRWGHGLKLAVDGVYKCLNSSNNWKMKTPMSEVLNKMTELSILPKVLLR